MFLPMSTTQQARPPHNALCSSLGTKIAKIRGRKTWKKIEIFFHMFQLAIMLGLWRVVMVILLLFRTDGVHSNRG